MPTRRKPRIIPVFLPNAGCGQRCVFCSQTSILSDQPHPSIEDVSGYIEERLKTSRLKNGDAPELAFYGGTFTGLPRIRIPSYVLRDFSPGGKEYDEGGTSQIMCPKCGGLIKIG